METPEWIIFNQEEFQESSVASMVFIPDMAHEREIE
jgi:hypothetical protein